MKFHSATFEKSLRREVRKALRHSPDLKRQATTSRSRLNHNVPQPVFRVGLSIGLAIGLGSISEKTDNLQIVLSLVALWGVVMIFVRASAFVQYLYRSPDLRYFFLLPVSEPLVFKWELQKFLRSTVYLTLDFAFAFAAIGFALKPTFIIALGILPLAAIASSAVISLTLLLVARFPAFPYGHVSTFLFGTAFLLLLGRDYVGAAVLRALNVYAPILTAALPTGWPGKIFECLLTGSWWSAIAIVPLAGIFATIPGSVSRIRRYYLFTEVTVPESSDIIPEPAPSGAAMEGAHSDSPRWIGQTAIEEVIASRVFLAAPPWSESGRMERFFWRWLSVREKAISEFVFPNGVLIARSWSKIFRNLGITMLASLVARLVAPGTDAWILGLGLFVTISQALLRILTTGRAFASFRTGGVNAPIHAVYGIGFRELATFLLKFSVAQSPLLLSFAAGAGLMISWQFSVPYGVVFPGSIKAGLLLLSARMVALTFGFSGTTNDSLRIRPGMLLMLLILIPAVGSFLLFGVASVFVPQQSIAMLCLLAAILSALAMLATYGWFYNTKHFDLLRPVQH
jgi:hypothetical protein